MGQKNKWKIAFIILVSSLFLIFVGSVLFLWSLGHGDSLSEIPRRDTLSGPSFTVLTTKDDLNIWIERELEQEESDVPFQLYMDDFVYFQSHVPVFTFTVPIEMVLEPQVTDTGNLELYERSFQIGEFSLPSERVFQLIRSTIPLPDWILVFPTERKFYIDLNGIGDEIQIKVNSFDLEKDELEFTITL